MNPPAQTRMGRYYRERAGYWRKLAKEKLRQRRRWQKEGQLIYAQIARRECRACLEAWRFYVEEGRDLESPGPT